MNENLIRLGLGLILSVTPIIVFAVCSCIEKLVRELIKQIKEVTNESSKEE